MFNVDFAKFILWLLPDFKRKPKHYAWLRALCHPVVELFDLFTKKRAANLYKINHSGQVFSMEAVLNDRFDTVERRIYITVGFNKDRIYLFNRVENKPRYLGTMHLHGRGDYGDTGVDFIVWVPVAVTLTASENYELTSLINTYKLAGKRYKIYR